MAASGVMLYVVFIQLQPIQLLQRSTVHTHSLLFQSADIRRHCVFPMFSVQSRCQLMNHGFVAFPEKSLCRYDFCLHFFPIQSILISTRTKKFKIADKLVLKQLQVKIITVAVIVSSYHYSAVILLVKRKKERKRLPTNRI